MKIIIFLSVFLMAQVGMAKMVKPGNYNISGSTLGFYESLTAESGQLIHIWTVSKSTEVYSLEEFVKSGRFCLANGGHRWWPSDEKQVIWAYAEGLRNWSEMLPTCDTDWFCLTCHRCRQKVKVQKEEMEWEK